MPHAYRLRNRSVEAAVAKTSKGARRWERSSGSIAEAAGICGHNQQECGFRLIPHREAERLNGVP